MYKFLYNSILASLSVSQLHQSRKNNNPNTLRDHFDALRNRIQCNRIFLVGLILALTISALVFAGIGAKNALSPVGSHDFQWTPTRDYIAGVSPYSDFLSWKAEGNKHTPPHFLNQSPSYPASVYVLLTPFGHLDWPTAKLIWLCINLVLISLLLWGLQKLYPLKSPLVFTLVALLFLCSTPLRTSLGAGQLNFLSLAAFVWAYYFVSTNIYLNSKIAGVLLALAWVKYSLTFPLTLLFIYRGKWQPIIVASLIHAMLTVTAAIQIDMWPHEFFFNSVEVVLMGDGTGFLNLVALSMTLNLPMALAVSAIVAASTFVLWLLPRLSTTDDLLLMTFLGLFSCAVFYHHGYDFIVLLLCAWAIARNQLQGLQAFAAASLLILAWGGQWLVYELAPLIGPAGLISTQIVDNLLVVTFYCTLALVWASLYNARNKTPAVIALSF